MCCYAILMWQPKVDRPKGFGRILSFAELGLARHSEILTHLSNVRVTSSLLHHFIAESIHPPTQSPLGFDPVAMIFPKSTCLARRFPRLLALVPEACSYVSSASCGPL